MIGCVHMKIILLALVYCAYRFEQFYKTRGEKSSKFGQVSLLHQFRVIDLVLRHSKIEITILKVL